MQINQSLKPTCRFPTSKLHHHAGHEEQYGERNHDQERRFAAILDHPQAPVDDVDIVIAF